MSQFRASLDNGNQMAFPTFNTPAAFLDHVQLISTIDRKKLWQDSVNNAKSMTFSGDWRHIEGAYWRYYRGVP